MVGASNLYQHGLLIDQTRKLAADYRASTGKTLPVGPEIALYDAATTLGLFEPEAPMQGVDLVSETQEFRFQLKSRALFGGAKSAPRLGSINKNGDWTHVLLVLLNEAYETTHLYALDKSTALSELSRSKNPMTVAKFKVLGDCLWEYDGAVVD